MLKKYTCLLHFLISLFVSKNTFAQQLKKGDLAPTIVTQDCKGNNINLNEWKGQKIWVSFLRYAGCPVCNFRVHELLKNYDQIVKSGYKLIAIFESEQVVLNKYASDYNIPFTLIGNPDLNIYNDYKVEKSNGAIVKSTFSSNTFHAMKSGKKEFTEKIKRDGSLNRIPADFLIDENGIIETAFYGKTISSHLPLSNIIK
ncbi:MAG: redoxin domain-containing protein [Cytophagales bacterium]